MQQINISNFIDDDELQELQEFLFLMRNKKKRWLYLRNDILLSFQEYLKERNLTSKLPDSQRFLQRIQEMLVFEKRMIIVYRHRLASSHIYALEHDMQHMQELSIREFLKTKERYINPNLPFNHRTMEIDFSPFFQAGPSIKDPSKIGHGVEHINRYLSAHLSQTPQKWSMTIYSFLSNHTLLGHSLLVNKAVISSAEKLLEAVEFAIDYLERTDLNGNKAKVRPKPDHLRSKLHSWGFLDGWGNTPKRISETMNLLQAMLEQPSEDILENFLARMPMVASVAIISPHGWFGQSNVLGRPDTGGQVVYILDQVKAMEAKLQENLNEAGLDIQPKIIIITRLIPNNEGTSSNRPKEQVHSTANTWIVRLPFYDDNHNIVNHWISRFEIWPYLDQFAVDSTQAICSEFSGKPQLIIGNYSDGNLVATEIASKLGTLQCNIAHALEKPKYLFSDLYWDKQDDTHHFSVQFSADLIAMNRANIIIASTAQEIVGTDSTIGQYESYSFFTMPGLMQINCGNNMFHHKYNIIPPGVDQAVYYPYHEHTRRIPKQTSKLRDTLFTDEGKDIFGYLKNPDLPPILTIARLDYIKNITGLIEIYGQNPRLKELANLIIVAGTLHLENSRDEEEAREIRRMYELIDKYELHGHIRWLGARLPTDNTGEAYRIAADCRGIFIQPAFFEAFGLTVLEAMHSGLPVFATRFGGPLEIINDGQDGFLINPTDLASSGNIIADFLEKSQSTPQYWDEISAKACERAQAKFTWNHYCTCLLRMVNTYLFWRHYENEHMTSNMTAHYCDLLYDLYYKPRAAQIKPRG